MTISSESSKGWVPRHLQEFAASRIVHILRRDHLWQDIRNLLNATPNVPSNGEMVSLDTIFDKLLPPTH